MKLQAIKKLCQASGQCCIIDAPDGEQWLSNGAHYFRMVAMRAEAPRTDRGPRMETVVSELFGMTAKQADKIVCFSERKGDALFGGSARIYGDLLTPIRDVWAFDQLLLALQSASGVLYVTHAALDAAKYTEDSDFTLVHTDDGDPLVAVQNGMFCDALLAPIDATHACQVASALCEITRQPVWTDGKEVAMDGTAQVN